ncbi:MAG TPA: hypothetical protein VHY82_00345 [Acetobacteraceae bacterium]|jgi:hypothetical protein|nr:hypothetical protein [Acetobacteraceae bacterium]
MRTMIFATAAVLALGAGSAFAGEGEGTHANTLFTELPGVVAHAPVQQQVPSAVARNQTGNPPTAAFVTNNHSGTWVFPPNPNQGANS